MTTRTTSSFMLPRRNIRNKFATYMPNAPKCIFPAVSDVAILDGKSSTGADRAAVKAMLKKSK